MLKLWVLLSAAAGVLQLVPAAPASRADQPTAALQPLCFRLPPLHLCLSPLSDGVHQPLSDGVHQPLSEDRLVQSDWPGPWYASEAELMSDGQERLPSDEEEEVVRDTPAPHRGKREPGSSLSINNPLQVLRRRVMLELVRRRMQQQQTQINANSEILHQLGKRSAEWDPVSEHQSVAGFLKSEDGLLNR